MGRLSSKVAIVTGAGRGLGYGIARRLAREGATVVVAELDEETGPAARDAIAADYGAECLFRRTDVGQEADARGLVADAYARYGRVDILVNCAQGFTRLDLIEHKPTEMMEFSYRTGVLASFWTMAEVAPIMRAQQDGRIINFTSLNGVNGEPLFADYNSTKEAIRGLTRTAAREMGRYGVRVNCIAPAGLSPAHVAHEAENPEFARRIRKAIALGYVGDPEEDIGGAVMMLCSDEARFITGMTIYADGGLHLAPVSSFDLEEWDDQKIVFNPGSLQQAAGLAQEEGAGA